MESDTRGKFKKAGVRGLTVLSFFICFCSLGFSQEAAAVTGMSGMVVNDDTGETLPYVQIYFLKDVEDQGTVPSEIGTVSSYDGRFEVTNTEGLTTLCFQMLGYKTELVTLRAGQFRKNARVRMEPDIYGLQDIVVTPTYRKRDYKRKNNPAVELIKNVIAHKEQHDVKTANRYTAQTYARASFAADNLKINWEKGIWKNFQFVEKYIDTTGVYPNLTVSIRENVGEEFFQRRPHREKKIIEKKRIAGLEDRVSFDSFKDVTDAIFKDVDINDNNMNLLLNRFVSPLSSSLAVSFYQYFIQDTLMVDGYECIDLAFVPVNAESYGFTGHLYIVNDSTYHIKRYAINVPTNINLNFVSDYSLEGSYKQLDNGLWAPDRVNTYAKFYVLNRKRGMLARQTKIYTHWDLESPIAPETFSAFTAEEVESDDSTAVRVASKEWDNLRPEPLTKTESSVIELVDEFVRSRRHSSLALFGNSLLTQYIATTPAHAMNESKFDIGPIYNFISWNMLEGVRLRFGGTTTAKMHPQVFARAYVAFGTTDLRPKYEATLVYTFDKHKRHPYDGLRHHLQWTAMYDVEEPGKAFTFVRRDNILMSIPTSKPVIGFNQYVFHARMEYMKEWRNKLSLKAAFDFSNNEAAGALRYERMNWESTITSTDTTWTLTKSRIPSYRCYEGMIELQYSPGSRVPIDRLGYESPFALETDAPTLRLTHYVGYLDDRHYGGDGFIYNRTEFLFDKRFWFSAFGHLDLRVQTGMVWQKVPFTRLYIPQTSSSLFLAPRAFNQMKPMEFLMDTYVALYATYYFKGWILNRIPGINKLKLRGVVSFSGIYGALTKKNNPYLETGSGLYEFPHTEFDEHTFKENGYLQDGYRVSSPIGKMPYLELTAGFENIFKFLRIDYVRRLTYNDYELPYRIQKMEPIDPNNPTLGMQPAVDADGHPVMIPTRRRIGAWGRNGVKITVRITL